MSEYVYKSRLKLTPAQRKIEASKARFKIVKAGRRFGKTKYAVRWMILQAIKTPGEDHYYVAPTYRMAAEIAWREFMAQLDPDIIKRCNERALEIELITGARICLKGSENEDSLRGRRLGSLVVEEAAYHKPNVWAEILRPMLADLKAPALFISSPRRGWFTTLYQYAETRKDKDFEAWHFTIYDNPYIDAKEIDQIKATSSDMVFRKEYMAEEIEQEGAVYLEFTPARNIARPNQFPGASSFPTVVGADWGHDDDTGVVWIPITPYGFAYVAKEHVRNGWDVRRHAEMIQRLSMGMEIRRENYVLDTSAFRKEGTSQKSIADMFANEMGFYFQRSHKGSVDYGTDLVKRFLRGDGETPWLYVNPNCKETIRAFQEWEWGQHEPDVLAALRYGLTHAVIKKMTKLHEQLPRLKIDTSVLSQPKDLELIRRKSVRDSWDWDYENGAPLG